MLWLFFNDFKWLHASINFVYWLMFWQHTVIGWGTWTLFCGKVNRRSTRKTLNTKTIPVGIGYNPYYVYHIKLTIKLEFTRFISKWFGRSPSLWCTFALNGRKRWISQTAFPLIFLRKATSCSSKRCSIRWWARLTMLFSKHPSNLSAIVHWGSLNLSRNPSHSRQTKQTKWSFILKKGITR